MSFRIFPFITHWDAAIKYDKQKTGFSRGFHTYRLLHLAKIQLYLCYYHDISMLLSLPSLGHLMFSSKSCI